MQQKSVNITHPEVNAFMHQQMAILQHALPQNSKVGVVVVPNSSKDVGLDTPVSVKLVIMVHGLRIEVPASGDNIFDALIYARQVALDQISQITNQIASDESRSELISHFRKNGHLH